MGAGGGDPQALPLGRLDQDPAARRTASRTSPRVEQTGVFISTIERYSSGWTRSPSSGSGRGQDPPGHRAQLAGGRVDELVLLLDPEAERLAQVARPRMRSTNWR